jgi:hypothetical protein
MNAHAVWGLAFRYWDLPRISCLGFRVWTVVAGFIPASPLGMTGAGRRPAPIGLEDARVIASPDLPGRGNL